MDLQLNLSENQNTSIEINDQTANEII